jgi:TRAP-type C4-dicarboxylate transport system permease small subunit
VRKIETLAAFCAILAGVVLTLITLITVMAVLGREVLGKTVAGDFELVGVAAGAAIALFLPWCQVKRGNIVVDFFTTGASAKAINTMDRFGSLLMALMAGVFAWRSTLGGLNVYDTHSGTMMLNFPEWIIYALMVPPLALTALVGLLQALGFEPSGDKNNANAGSAA